jgi:hypothetical protein
MAFPTSPANGATTVINGITYSYNSTDLTWSPVAATANASVVLTSGATFTGAVIFNAAPTFNSNPTFAANVGVGTTVNNVYDGIASARPLVIQSNSTTTSPGSSTNSITIVNSDTTANNVSQINFAAITGASTNQYSSAWIAAIHGTRVNTQYPTGQLVFATSNSTNSAPAERMRIDSTGNTSVTGTVTPAATNTYDLGATSLRWRNIYTQDLHLSNGIGDYTVVEGEEDLFLVNNKSGKSFKFALIEVDPSVVPPKSNS